MKKIIGLAILATALTGTAALAGFVTSSVGRGAATNANAAPALNDIFNAGDTSAPTLAATLAALNTCLANNVNCATNQKTAALDTDGDGVLSQAEILQTFRNMSCLSGVPTQDKYARAVIMEVNTLGSIDDCVALQTAITTAAGYAVDAPTITASSIAFSGLNSVHSAMLGISDGLGNAIPGSGSSTTSVSATHSTDTDAANRFVVSSTGNLILSSGVDVEDLEPGTYTVSVTVSDSNTLTYGLSTTKDVTLTVSNEKGCITNGAITTANFNTNGDNSAIDGATVTIDGSHNANDLLFIHGASKSTSGAIVTYTNFGLSGVTATYNKGTGQLTFAGSASLTNWVSTFKKVSYVYESATPASSTSRSLIYALSGNVVFSHSDGSSHFYKYITNGSINFGTARAAADASTFFGLQGYLATITSASEQNYIEPKLNGVGWIGGCDRIGDSVVQSRCGITSADLNALKGLPKSSWTDTAGFHTYGDGESYFYWVTGPERLEFIGEDTRNCSTSNYAERKQETLPISSDTSLTDPQVSIVTSSSNLGYHNFKGCEPNNWRHTGEGENYLHVYGSGAWNDFRHDDSSISGYLIEYGGMSGDPSVDLTESNNYNAATDGQYCAY